MILRLVRGIAGKRLQHGSNLLGVTAPAYSKMSSVQRTAPLA